MSVMKYAHIYRQQSSRTLITLPKRASVIQHDYNYTFTNAPLAVATEQATMNVFS